MLVAFIMPATYMAVSTARQQVTASNTRSLYHALRLYCDDHTGHLPPTSMALVREAGFPNSILDGPDGQRILYLPEVVGMRISSAGVPRPEAMPRLDALPPDTVIFFVPCPGERRLLVVCADGVTREVSRGEFEAMWERSEETLRKAMPIRQ
jgi:hypothetical protein